MSDFLQELRRDLITFNTEHWPRSQQTVLGASDTYGCRAKGLLKLIGVPASDEKMSWPANVGNSVDEWVGRVRCLIDPNRQAQLKVTYRGVPCTIDEYDPTTKILTDWKTKDDAKKISDVRRYGPEDAQKAQVHLGAAGLIEAGHEVETVRLCFLPRAGDLEDGYCWEAKFDRAEADRAADWHAHQVAVAEAVRSTHRKGEVPNLDDIRDKPVWWCRDYCEHVTTCRGLNLDMEPTDPETLEIAQNFLAAKLTAEEAESQRDYYRKQLATVRGPIEVDGYRLAWSGGNSSSKEEVDVDEMKRAFRLLIGEPPTKTVDKVTSRSLRATKVRAK